MQIIKYVPRASGDEPSKGFELDSVLECAPRQRG